MNIIEREIAKRHAIIEGVDTKKAIAAEKEAQVAALLTEIDALNTEIAEINIEVLNAEIAELESYLPKPEPVVEPVEEAAVCPVCGNDPCTCVATEAAPVEEAVANEPEVATETII